MTETLDVLAQAAALVLADIQRTTPILLGFTAYPAVTRHPRGVKVTQGPEGRTEERTTSPPRLELRGVFALDGIEPEWARHNGVVPGWDRAIMGVVSDAPLTVATQQIAYSIQELVQVNLAAAQQDPTWPGCPLHPGTHPLTTEEVMGRWVCPTARYQRSSYGYAWPGIPIGSLGEARVAPILVRRAGVADIRAIVAMLADDPLGAAREHDALDERYLDAFRRIDKNWHDRLVVAEIEDEIVATLQISYLTSLSRGGAIRAQIEAVRVARDARGRGVGEALVSWAIGEAAAYGCALIQLTSDNTRTDAHRFYSRLGFVPSHTGFKLDL